MFLHKSAYLVFFILVSVLSFTAHAASTPHWVHYKLLKGKPKLPKKLVILPVNIEVKEVTAGDVKETVPKWSKKAAKNITKSLSTLIKKDKRLRQVRLPRLSSRTSKVVDEHMALYKLVVNTATEIRWEHKARRFDYGIGPGLRALRRQTGADAAVMVYGRDHVSTGGRITKSVLANIPVVNWFTGPAPRLGDSFVHVGIVDLRTGDLLWMNSEYRDDTSNLTDYGDANSFIKNIFEWYPGIEKYRDVYVK